MKVKVRSIYREGTAKTGRTWGPKTDKHPMGEEIAQYRQFVPPLISMKNGSPRYASYGECYMTLEEARFLVEGHENRLHTEMGEVTPYSYPAGVPLPVADEFDGALLPPVTAKTMHVTDSRQSEAAQRMMADRDASLGTTATASETPKESSADRKTRKTRKRAEERNTEIDADDSGKTPLAPGVVDLENDDDEQE